ncbi:MAG: HemK/PrmC family methyltransferase [Mobiluncus porci]|uniref:peptide chain release factor N(5)-glutamine methyltransferase n=1 Tax=Mobiluncus porci TaxID=2652278 RepID=A0A7K0K2P5_9ACTO|nr:HemK/PrmC family methyltransferase [Mobiluncus porci]MDD7542480.1 peptide chain release factor N(5)-glutamine methyltransferase [Mobiluncus porci]MDY5748777.1 HemK/PrmC family methyltransferase [Mobiluncus porci]MST49762.1 peptide chain release factor N(5)-glutamine methyltransferase [Mobiluncus porci]
MKIPENAAVRTAINDAAFVLSEAGIGNARGEATLLAEHVLGHRPGSSERMDSEKWQEFFSLVGQRARRVPLQHVMGIMYFRHLTLHARSGVFVARPETEMVAEAAIDAAREWVARGVSPRVLDLGCGSGALGLSVVSEVPQTLLTAVDISPAAVELTEENAKFVGVPARVILADATQPEALREALRSEMSLAAFHVFATNPPYVIEAVTQPEASADPPAALYGGGPDGLEIPRRFLVSAVALATPGATIVMEHGETQGEALVEAARELGLENPVTRPDLAGCPRFLVAKTPESLTRIES